MSSLAKKLLMKPGTNWLLYNAPEIYINLLEPLPNGLKLNLGATDNVDGIQVFITNMEELKHGIGLIKSTANPKTIIWLSYPKKSSGVKTDLNLDMMNNWPELTEAGLETVSLVAIDTVWSALRLRAIGQAKRSGVGNTEVKQNDYSAYVDVDNKIVTLPPDIQEALQTDPIALANYNKLAYSHRKEYVLWILSAKQQKTRDDRLVKMVSMLVNGKRNPGEK